jgi:hypothetical protein
VASLSLNPLQKIGPPVFGIDEGDNAWSKVFLNPGNCLALLQVLNYGTKLLTSYSGQENVSTRRILSQRHGMEDDGSRMS